MSTLLMLASFVWADHTVIFGRDSYTNTMNVPVSICVFPGQELRVHADLVNYRGEKQSVPAHYSVWRLTQSNGFYWQWDARFSPRFGPFRIGQEPNSIYVSIPEGLGPYGALEAEVPGPAHSVARVRIVDVTEARDDDCTFAYSDIYLDEDSTEPPAEPSENQGFDCYNLCVVGFQCSDACPRGARCERREFENPDLDHWKVRSCFR